MMKRVLFTAVIVLATMYIVNKVPQLKQIVG